MNQRLIDLLLVEVRSQLVLLCKSIILLYDCAISTYTSSGQPNWIMDRYYCIAGIGSSWSPCPLQPLSIMSDQIKKFLGIVHKAVNRVHHDSRWQKKKKKKTDK